MQKTIIAVILMATVTYIPRVLPMLFVKERSKSRFLRSFLYYVPFAALGAMTFPGILCSTGDITSALIGMIVAITLAFFEKGLLEVAVGAIVTVYLIQLFVQ
ncbi:MAG: AzlD domain-containing protein [Firmicutes bacterium]|jgi:branched-subunit amino acid transport protein|nr:AzlD domain-containing protein [Bacillota bacterium]